jgi:hypothetical protein
VQGRDLDATARGLGGTASVPTTSVGEENLTMVDDEIYPCQSVFVHELGHSVGSGTTSRRFATSASASHRHLPHTCAYSLTSM